MARKITKVVVEGYTSIRSAEIDLGALTVLIGANGSGKSNFISALEFLGKIVEGDLAYEVGLRGGASALMHHGATNSDRIRLRIEGLDHIYEAVLVTAEDDELIFSTEDVAFVGSPDHVVTEDLGRGHRASRLTWAVPGADSVLEMLRGCRVYHFQDTSRDAPVKQQTFISDNIALRSDAGNLAAFLLRLKDAEPDHYRRIQLAVRGVAPFFGAFVLDSQGSDYIRLRWRQLGADPVFPASALSDGTLRYICLATLLLQPDPPPLLVLDEPELGLHPFAIVQLAEMLRSVSTRSQVVLATQSTTLLNQFELNDIVVAERHDGETTLRRLDVERLQSWLDEYSVGELWEKNVIGGRPSPEAAPQD